MTSRAQLASLPKRVAAGWISFSTHGNPILVIGTAWALLVVPLMFLRGFNSDEGVAVTIARTALEDGTWLTPHMFNVRFVERPTMLSWVIGIVSIPFGAVSQFTARLPTVAALLGCCFLIHAQIRNAGGSLAAALFGAAIFLACPIVMRSYVIATADLPLAVLLFCAFFLWWRISSDESIRLAHWIAIGCILAVAGLMKGPQPIAYFALGVGTHLLLVRQWRQIPMMALAGLICVVPLALWYWIVYEPGDELQWLGFMRIAPGVQLQGPLKMLGSIFLNVLPASLLSILYLTLRRGDPSERARSRLVNALTCYAVVASLGILFWPGGSAIRYYLPMVPALCVLGGLAFDAWVRDRPQLLAPFIVVTIGGLAYALVYSLVAAPLLPHKFRSAQIEGQRMAELIRKDPAPVYRLGPAGLNEFLYVFQRPANVDLNALQSMKGPAWIAVPADVADLLVHRRGDALRVIMPLGSLGEWRLLRLDN